MYLQWRIPKSRKQTRPNIKFFQNVLFADEAYFNQQKVFNHRNLQPWDYEIQNQQRCWSVNVWTGTCRKRIIIFVKTLYQIEGNFGSQFSWSGPIPRPPRSPDLTPINFWLWKNIKENLLYCSCHEGMADINVVSILFPKISVMYWRKWWYFSWLNWSRKFFEFNQVTFI